MSTDMWPPLKFPAAFRILSTVFLLDLLGASPFLLLKSFSIEYFFPFEFPAAPAARDLMSFLLVVGFVPFLAWRSFLLPSSGLNFLPSPSQRSLWGGSGSSLGLFLGDRNQLSACCAGRIREFTDHAPSECGDIEDENISPCPIISS